MFATSIPVGRRMTSMRNAIRYRAFTATASVIATCKATRSGPVLLRNRALINGGTSISTSLLRSEENRWRHAADTPRGIQTGEQTRDQRQSQCRGEHGEVHVREILRYGRAVWIPRVCGEERGSHSGQSNKGQQQP